MLISIRHSWYLYKRNVTAKMQHILQHIMVWVKPIWAYSVPVLKDFEWILEVEQVCTRETSRAETAETAENASPSLDKMGDDVIVLLGI